MESEQISLIIFNNRFQVFRNSRVLSNIKCVQFRHKTTDEFSIFVIEFNTGTSQQFTVTDNFEISVLHNGYHVFSSSKRIMMTYQNKLQDFTYLAITMDKHGAHITCD